MSPRPRARGCARALIVFLLAIVLLVLLRAPLLRAVGGFLEVSDEIEPADVILMLPGDLEARPQRVAELYHGGLAPMVAIVRPEDRVPQRVAAVPNEADLARTVLVRFGLPDSAIVIIAEGGPSTSTRDDARIFAMWAAQQGIDGAIVVTSAFHMRRARWLLRRALPDSVRLMMAPAQHDNFGASNWWHSEEGLLAYITEYLKLVHNRLN